MCEYCENAPIEVDYGYGNEPTSKSFGGEGYAPTGQILKKGNKYYIGMSGDGEFHEKANYCFKCGRNFSE